jgi:hypothetical protein
MGADIHGWVETRVAEGEEWWEAAIRIHDIVHRQYGMFASLFGLRNGAPSVISAVGRFRAIAPARGAPPGASYYYEQDRDNYGGAVGETWVLWSELASIDWDEKGTGELRERRGDYLNGGWATLFKMMEQLAEQFGADNVRLSVWFDQW